MKRIPASAAVLLSATAFLIYPSHPLVAQGYGVYEQGTCVMARAGTGVASPCGDGSSIYFNPAGIATATSTQIGAGGTGIFVSGSFTDDYTGFETDLDHAMHPVPHAYVVTPVGDRFAAGVGVFVPYGLSTDWPTDFEGRFLGYHSKVQAIYLQPTLAMRSRAMAPVSARTSASRPTCCPTSRWAPATCSARRCISTTAPPKSRRCPPA
jgi:long-chain fatty acid transport protein